MAMLKKLGMEDKIAVPCNELSGGQKQRVAIARALINEPKIIIADEPTGALDRDTSKEIMDCLKEINSKYNITIIIVTHDIDITSNCKKTIRVSNGRIIE